MLHDETSFPRKLLLTNTQVSNICTAFLQMVHEQI